VLNRRVISSNGRNRPPKKKRDNRVNGDKPRGTNHARLNIILREDPTSAFWGFILAPTTTATGGLPMPLLTEIFEAEVLLPARGLVRSAPPPAQGRWRVRCVGRFTGICPECSRLLARYAALLKRVISPKMVDGVRFRACSYQVPKREQ